MKFSKIKFNGYRVELIWSTRAPGSLDETETKLSSGAAPRPEFVAAFNAFKPLALDLLELPEYGEGFIVTGLSINEEDNDGRGGLVITSMKTLKQANAPLVLNTPHLREPVDDNQDGAAGFYTEGMSGALATMLGEAKRYVNGERAQQELALEEGKKPPKVEKKGKGVDATISINGGPQIPFEEVEKDPATHLKPLFDGLGITK